MMMKRLRFGCLLLECNVGDVCVCMDIRVRFVLPVDSDAVTYPGIGHCVAGSTSFSSSWFATGEAVDTIGRPAFNRW